MPITKGLLVRHAGRLRNAGLPAALVDVGQDILLADLLEAGELGSLVLKGGTALRKFYAGNAGRFSTDLDFSLADPSLDKEDVTEQLIEAIDGRTVGDFTFGIKDDGKYSVTYATDLGDTGNLTSKLDIGPPVWIQPTLQNWIPLPIHKAYELPETGVPTMALVENMAEKIARLNRLTPARDIYDLVWIATNTPHSSFDRVVVRRLAVLKIWVDQYGLDSPPSKWVAAPNPRPYKAERWLERRAKQEFDDENIASLTTPAPTMEALAEDFFNKFQFLAQADELEKSIIDRGARSRGEVIEAIRDLGNEQFAERAIY